MNVEVPILRSKESVPSRNSEVVEVFALFGESELISLSRDNDRGRLDENSSFLLSDEASLSQVSMLCNRRQVIHIER